VFVDEVSVGEAELQADQDGAQVSPCVPAWKTEQTCTMQWGVASVEKLCCRALVYAKGWDMRPRPAE
jgi:hypothetical protein